jgi:hypothetical protein
MILDLLQEKAFALRAIFKGFKRHSKKGNHLCAENNVYLHALKHLFFILLISKVLSATLCFLIFQESLPELQFSATFKILLSDHEHCLGHVWLAAWHTSVRAVQPDAALQRNCGKFTAVQHVYADSEC